MVQPSLHGKILGWWTDFRDDNYFVLRFLEALEGTASDPYLHPPQYLWICDFINVQENYLVFQESFCRKIVSYLIRKFQEYKNNDRSD